MKLRSDWRRYVKTEAKSGLKTLLLLPVAALAFQVLWFSPTFVNYAKTWTRVYRVCVAEAPPAATLGHVFITRRGCARLATREASR
jgi:hypothetical protein